MRFARGLIAGLLITLWDSPPAGGPQDDHPLTGRIWSVEDRRFLSEDRLLDRLASADVVILGEQHDNPRHHEIQAHLIHRLAREGGRPAVVFEMLQADQQETVDAVRSRRPDDVDALAEAVDWAGSGWPEWRHYRPVFAAAYRHDLPIVAGNLPAGQARRLVREGPDALPPARRRELGMDRSLPARERDALEAELRESHCGMLPEDMIPRMALAQRARDGALAAAAVAAGAERGAVVITGNGHARTDRGVPRAVGHRAPGRRTVALALQPVSPEAREPQAYAAVYGGDLPFDFVRFTMATLDHGDDPCAALRERSRE